MGAGYAVGSFMLLRVSVTRFVVASRVAACESAFVTEAAVGATNWPDACCAVFCRGIGVNAYAGDATHPEEA